LSRFLSKPNKSFQPRTYEPLDLGRLVQINFRVKLFYGFVNYLKRLTERVSREKKREGGRSVIGLATVEPKK